MGNAHVPVYTPVELCPIYWMQIRIHKLCNLPIKWSNFQTMIIFRKANAHIRSESKHGTDKMIKSFELIYPQSEDWTRILCVQSKCASNAATLLLGFKN